MEEKKDDAAFVESGAARYLTEGEVSTVLTQGEGGVKLGLQSRQWVEQYFSCSAHMSFVASR